jgi:Flp pilus assembly protein TadG
MMTNGSRRKERGATMAEFAVIASVFFMIIFGIIEFGRLLYTHNALTDASRRGARYAVLHGEDKITCVKNVVVYGETRVDPSTCAVIGTPDPLINNLGIGNVVVTYEGADADNNPATPPTAFGMNLGTATVSIQNYSFTLAIPFVGKTFTMGAYTTTLTSESAGTEPSPLPTP